MPDEDPKATYERLRAAHLTAVRASLEDHVARLDWPRERIERYQTERLRSLLGYARERSPFHAARLANFDPATATVDDLARLPPMVKQDAQNDWDAIITTPDITRAGAEQVLAQQPWFSYTPAGYQVFSSGARAAYAVCMPGIGSSSSHSPVLPGGGRRVRSALPDQTSTGRDSACSRPASRHTPAHRCSTSLPSHRWRP